MSALPRTATGFVSDVRSGRFAMPTTWEKAKALMARELNFYRIHLLAFIFIPLFFSGVMYGINTENHIRYIDCLFLCFSSMCVNGLATIDLSALSTMQQVIMFWQMLIGSLVFVSIVMIVVRQYFFRLKFKHVIQEQQRQSLLQRTISRVATTRTQPLSAIKRRFSTILKQPNQDQEMQSRDMKAEPSDSTPSSNQDLHAKGVPLSPFKKERETHKERETAKHKKKKGIDKNMIIRVGGGGMGMVNPMGWYDERGTPASSPISAPKPLDHVDVKTQERGSEVTARDWATPPASGDDTTGTAMRPTRSALGLSLNMERRMEEDDDPDQVFTASPVEENSPELPPTKTAYAGKHLTEDAFPRSRTIAFNDEEDDGLDHEHNPRGFSSAREGGYMPRTATVRSHDMPRTMTGATSAFPRTHSLRPSVSRQPDTRMSGYGGFPTPFELIRMFMNRFFPKATLKVSRTMTMPRTNTIAGRGTINSGTLDDQETKEVPYISFAAVVGRNSRFHDLTEEQMDELGGVEYRGLRVLLYTVSAYFVFLQLAGFVIIAPYIAAGNRYNDVFEAQHRYVSTTWFSLFNAVSAFSNTGTSLCDQSLLPFQTAYLMNFVIMFLIYAGNTAFPVFLRLTVWTTYKLCPSTSRLKETLKFLLDHPRRCFVYMFPSTQTWFLALLMFSLTMLDWVCFLVLDIGTPAIEQIPVGTRIAAAFVQSAAVRAAGFAIVPLASLAPAVKILYVIMMYISIYPIALSVRATNVYEERSLGLFDEDISDDEPQSEKGAQAVAKYVGWHARRQLAFDIWWLAFALWLVCIIEKSKIDREDTATWFNVFNIIFELVSAYGTVGLSLGSPIANYSFCGTFSTLSKLVVIAVMIRGRHRGLPVAIDRAVMLPRDFTAAEEQDLEEERSRRLSRMSSNFAEADIFRSHSRRPSHDTQQQQQQQRTGTNHSFSFPPPTSGSGNGNGNGDGRPTTPPNQIRSSISKSITTTGTGTGHSPRALSFSLPQKPSIERSPVMRSTMGGSGGGGGAGGTGALTPVKESMLSRNPSRVESIQEREQGQDSDEL